MATHSSVKRSKAIPLFALSLLLAAVGTIASAPPAIAQPMNGGYGPGMHDAGGMMRPGANPHMLYGTIASASPYRVLLAMGRQRSVQVDLKNGTVIRPMGTTLSAGMRVTVRGYWSKGTFIANRVTLNR